MKRFIHIIIAFSAMVLAAGACKKAEVTETIDPAVVGEWQLVSAVSEGHAHEQIPDIYLCINPDSTFELYQKSGTQSIRHDKFTGTCQTADGILNGVYSTGENWASKWEYETADDRLILTSFNLLEVNTYKKTTIPENVRNNANEVYTKSAASCTPIL